MFRLFKAVYLNFFITIFITACSSRTSIPQYGDSSRSAFKAGGAMIKEELLSSLLDNEYRNWKGVPYRFGGTTKKGVDCSGFVQAVYKNSFQINIVRNTEEQAKSGLFVNRNALKVGDLVFFKTRWKVRHVGIYLGDNQFVHASTSKGVVISSLNNVYWKKKYWQSRRIIY
jgi:hypothetical protein